MQVIYFATHAVICWMRVYIVPKLSIWLSFFHPFTLTFIVQKNCHNLFINWLMKSSRRKQNVFKVRLKQSFHNYLFFYCSNYSFKHAYKQFLWTTRKNKVDSIRKVQTLLPRTMQKTLKWKLCFSSTLNIKQSLLIWRWKSRRKQK